MKTPHTKQRIPISVEHYIDDHPEDPYECVSVTIGDWQEDLTMSDADELMMALAEATGQPPPTTPTVDKYH